jgi:uncharacterized protein GlcG (DUF336 family)/catechol 2,3-dioxygenase-like lactoylglutathione lyase family enzyme
MTAIKLNVVTLEDAQRIIGAAQRKALEIGQPMNIAVADAGGNLVAHARMNGAWLGSIDISIKKAYTARAFDIATKDLAAHSQCGQEFFGIHASNEGKIMIFAGGIPLKQDGVVVGAIGVSGGSAEQDQVVAEAGVIAFTTNIPTKINRIFHCNVNCTDLNKSLAFYQMLGFQVVANFTEGMSSEAMAEAFGMPYAYLRGVHLRLGDEQTATRIDLVEFQNPKTQGQPYPYLYHTGIARICLHTEDIEYVYQKLKAKDVHFLSEPKALPGTDATIVCFTDPDGNVLELIEGTF